MTFTYLGTRVVKSAVALTHEGYLKLYGLLFAAQTIGFAILLWEGVPIYRLISARVDGQHAGAGTLALIAAGIFLIQGGYWTSVATAQELRVPANIFIGHVIVFLARLSFIFGASFFTLVMYVRFPELEVSVWRLTVLVTSLFSIFCYSLELARLGEAFNKRSTAA
jgi:hypothetical protein